MNHATNFDRFNLYMKLLQDIINVREPNAYYYKFLILGDFNLANIEWYHHINHCIATNYEGRFAVEFLNTLALTNIIQVNPIRNHLNRSLDLAITNLTSVNVTRINGIVNEDLHHPSLLINLKHDDIKFTHKKNGR